MPRSYEQLRRDALTIWKAGVAAVQSDRLVREAIQVEGDLLTIGEAEFALSQINRIVVLGGGKAGAGMAAGLLDAIPPAVQQRTELSGWLNVPEDCVRELPRIHLHGARPAGVNEPTLAGVEGTSEILRRAAACQANDLCIVLLSGGGSALLPAPAAGIPLAEKLALTRMLSGAGANIEELNTVRSAISLIKGGGLARTCRAGNLVALIISDVLGDRLDVIASGPTLVRPCDPAAALRVLTQFKLVDSPAIPHVVARLKSARNESPSVTAQVHNFIIGNNATAVDAAGLAAEQLGYSHAMISATSSEGPAEEVGIKLAQLARRMAIERGPDCLISGGEPVVALPPEGKRGRGGRNQQLVLAALEQWRKSGSSLALILSGGTDGEDGPTDAAGAYADLETLQRATEQGLELQDYLARCDAYHFFDRMGGLIKTGPTHTNVCDVRVVLTARQEL